jgi:hypothetical protein
MAKSYRIDKKAQKLVAAKDFDQIPHGDSLVSAEHLAKCSPKGEASMIAKLGLSDARGKK